MCPDFRQLGYDIYVNIYLNFAWVCENHIKSASWFNIKTIHSNIEILIILIVKIKHMHELSCHDMSSYIPSYIRHTLIGNNLVDRSDVFGALTVGAAPTTSSFRT